MKQCNEIPAWLLEDLHNSGLGLDNFPIEPLRSKDELMERLGFHQIGGTEIMDNGGYWVPYPNVPG